MTTTQYARFDAEGQPIEIVDAIYDESGAEVPIDARYHPALGFRPYDPANPPEGPATVISAPQRIATLLAAVDLWLNAGAALRRYSSIVTAALRAGYPGPFHAEGIAYATWMDATYARCYEILAQWEAGEIEEPTAAELIAMLPLLELPV